VKLSQFLASVNIFIDRSQKNTVLSELLKLQNAKEVYEVAGEYDIVSLISASNLEEFRDILQKRVMKIKGVKSTITTVVLSRHKEINVNETKNGGDRQSFQTGKIKHE
jgi:DNA-binding Lrp family transcriptional regulator